MPTYEKPQSPIYSKTNDAYLYPLTTVDQVIMEDGSRLNSVGMLVVDNTDAVDGEAVPVNADTLGGKTEDELNVANAVKLNNKSESELSVADSAKLGGHSIDSLINKIYPIGSIYMSTSEVSPEILFGGTWEQIEDRFLLASGSSYEAGATGGEAEHTLTVDEMPGHEHTPSTYNVAGSESGYKRYFTTNLATGSTSVARTQIATGTSGKYAMTGTTSGDIAETAYTSSTGGSQSHNNMPPYLVVYVWKRTA